MHNPEQNLYKCITQSERQMLLIKSSKEASEMHWWQEAIFTWKQGNIIPLAEA